jgi:hypothetical protein
MRELFKKCDVCRRIVETQDGETVAAVEFTCEKIISGVDSTDLPKVKLGGEVIAEHEFERLYPELRYKTYVACYVCVLRALGVKIK